MGRMGASYVLLLTISFRMSDALQIVANQPTNPLGRSLQICTTIELGFVQSANDTDLANWPGMGAATSDGEWMNPVIFSAARGNLGQIRGHDVDIIAHLVGEYLGWTYEFHVYPSYSGAFYHGTRGRCDVVFGAFNSYIQRIQCHATPVSGESWGTVTSGCPNYKNPANTTTTASFWEAACCGVPLTPHYANGLAVIAEVPQVSSAQKMIDTLSGGFVANWVLLQSIGVLFFGHLMWALERWGESVDGVDNPQFPLSLTQGGQEGVWWALVTTTTVGYGDITVKQGFARIVAAAWMLFGFIAMACIIGALAAGLTAPSVEIETITTEGIRGKKVCTYAAYVDTLSPYGPILEPPGGVNVISECWNALKSGSVDAVVYEQANAFAARKQDRTLNKFSVGSIFLNFWQGGLMSAHHGNTQVQSALNWALGKLLDNHVTMKQMYEQWMGDGGIPQDLTEIVDPTTAITAAVLWGMFLTLQILSMNNPWMEWLREKIPQCGGMHDFVFGTCEERRSYAAYNSSTKDRWYESVPECCHPPLDENDDRGLFTGVATAAKGWKSQAAAQFKQLAQEVKDKGASARQTKPDAVEPIELLPAATSVLINETNRKQSTSLNVDEDHKMTMPGVPH